MLLTLFLLFTVHPSPLIHSVIYINYIAYTLLFIMLCCTCRRLALCYTNKKYKSITFRQILYRTGRHRQIPFRVQIEMLNETNKRNGVNCAFIATRVATFAGKLTYSHWQSTIIARFTDVCGDWRWLVISSYMMIAQTGLGLGSAYANHQ